MLDSSSRLPMAVFGAHRLERGAATEKQVPLLQSHETVEVCSFLFVSPLSWASASAVLDPPAVSSLASCLLPCGLFPYHFLTLPLCTFALAGEVGFEPCYAEVLRVVQGKLHQPDEIHRSSFYAFSYYYDRAVDTDMIGKFTLGVRSRRKPGKAVVGKGEGVSEMLHQRWSPVSSVLVVEWQ